MALRSGWQGSHRSGNEYGGSAKTGPGIRLTRFLNDDILAIHFVVPWAAMPVVVTRKVQNPGAGDVQRDVKIIRLLVKKVRRVRGVIAALPVVGASHVGAGAD